MIEIESIESLKNLLHKNELSNLALQYIDLTEVADFLLNKSVKKCIFLGCKMPDMLLQHLFHNNFVFPSLDVPFNIYPNRLYNKESLYDNFNPDKPDSYKNTLDYKIYRHFLREGKEAQDIKETLARRLHDHSITDALYDFLNGYEEKKIVGIMGGHDLGRNSKTYADIAELSKQLTEEGYLMISGGGPGAMEATHIGAWFAGKSLKVMKDAIKILCKAPLYNDPKWLSTAFKILESYPESKYKSLGIPTWLYGHEPPSPFATHIAKYFANSIREEGLLAIAKGGIVFTQGSAGTLQEIFQEITQNHYETFGYASPMVFYDKEYWSYERPVYPVIELMCKRGNLKHLNIGLYDSKNEVMQHIRNFTNS